MKAYKHLVKFALKNNCTVSVFDGECWDVKRSKSYKEIIDSINSVELAELRIRQGDEIVGWASVMDCLNFEPEETVIDYTITPFMNAWDESYKSATV